MRDVARLFAKMPAFFFLQQIRFFFQTLVMLPAHISHPSVCENWEEAPQDCSPSVSPVREADTGPKPTLSRNGGDEGPASSLHNVEFGSGTASINSDAAMFSARKFVVIPVFPLHPLANDVLVSALRFTPGPKTICDPGQTLTATSPRTLPKTNCRLALLLQMLKKTSTIH